MINAKGSITPEWRKIKEVGKQDLQSHYAFPIAVKEDICSGCMMCIAACENQNISFDEKKGVVVINEVACKGCGTCAAICPSGALFQRFLSSEQIFAAIDSDRDIDSCDLCPLSAMDFELPEHEKRSIRFVCAVHADPFVILRCFESGADNVIVIHCCSGEDRQRAEKSVKVAKELMETMGMNPERVHLAWISLLEQGFDKEVAEIVSCIEEENGKDF
ncbi:heterodisulfide reductase subunit A [Candidatus Methanophagaceae archaeon]|nr:heterodisulfide reductase subunit A [Methanophagales archaeon]